MSGGAIVIHKQNELIRSFNQAGAVDAEHAIYINKYGIRRSYVFDRMVLRGVFVECEPGKFYIDNDTVPDFIKQRRSRVIIMLSLVLALIIVYYLFK